MRFDRRNFLKLGAGAGLALVAAPLVRGASAAAPYQGPYFVHIHASGGWDPIYFCDPKSDPALARYPGVGTVGPFSYAATSIADLAAIGLDPLIPEISNYLMSNQAFFEKYQTRLRVVNGVDTATNNHDIGTRAAGSGQNTDSYPSFGALAAATLGRDKALAYVSNGGYDATQGLVATTRLSAASYARIAYPFESNTTTPGSAPYHLGGTQARIRAAQAARMSTLTARSHLPRVKRALGALETSRREDTTLSTLTLPTPIVLPGGLGDEQGVLQQVQLCLAAFDAGLGVSASIGLGGFDTHANHDQNHIRQLAKLLYAIDYLWESAATLGLADQITLMVTGDFGRGPGYNVTNGKDHWPVTSALFMGRGVTPGVVGSTDAGQRPVAVSPTTLAPNPNGVRITPAHLHQALRKLAGIEGSADAAAFPLAGGELPILG